MKSLEKIFTWRNVALAAVLELVAVLLHNLVSALFGVEEAFFFIIAVFLVPLFIILFLIYKLIEWIKKF